MIILPSVFDSEDKFNSIRKRRSVSNRKPSHLRNKSRASNKSRGRKKSSIPFKKQTISKPLNLDRVKQQEKVETLNNESERQFIVSQGVTYENQVNPQTNQSAEKSISLGDRNSSHVDSNQTISEEQKDDNSTSNGKAEIVIDSMKPNKTQDTSKSKITGKPIGMQFQYQADKLACVVKCHAKEHLEEAQNRVSYNLCFCYMAQMISIQFIPQKRFKNLEKRKTSF